MLASDEYADSTTTASITPNDAIVGLKIRLGFHHATMSLLSENDQYRH